MMTKTTFTLSPEEVKDALKQVLQGKYHEFDLKNVQFSEIPEVSVTANLERKKIKYSDPWDR